MRRIRALCVATMAVGVGCGGSGCTDTGLGFISQDVGLVSEPGPVLEFSPPAADEPTVAPALEVELRVGGAEQAAGRVVVAVDPAGTRLAAAGTWLAPGTFAVKRSEVAVWSMGAWEPELKLEPGTFVDALALGPAMLAFGGGYGAVFDVVQLPGGARRQVPLNASPPPRRGSAWLARLAMDARGERLAGCVNYTNDVLVWRASDFKLLSRGQHNFECELIAFSSDGQDLSVRYSLGRNRTFAVESGAVARAFTDGHFAEFTWSAFSPSGRLLATMSDGEPDVRLWDTRSGRQVRTLTTSAQGGPFTLLARFHPSGRQLVVYEGGDKLTLWQLEPARKVAAWKTPHQTEITGLEFSPDGRRLVSAGTDGSLAVWTWRPGPVPAPAPAGPSR